MSAGYVDTLALRALIAEKRRGIQQLERDMAGHLPGSMHAARIRCHIGELRADIYDAEKELQRYQKGGAR